MPVSCLRGDTAIGFGQESGFIDGKTCDELRQSATVLGAIQQSRARFFIGPVPHFHGADKIQEFRRTAGAINAIAQMGQIPVRIGDLLFLLRRFFQWLKNRGDKFLGKLRPDLRV
jgi:hypothetical protein